MNTTTANQKVIFGLWPIAGITSGAVSEQTSRDTIDAAINSGICWFDSAFSYGFDGESDRLLGEQIRGRRDQVRIIGKAGQRWTPDRQRIVDCSPSTLVADAEESLRRIGTDHFDLFMLHCVDPQVDLRQSAAAIASLQARQLTKQIGVCNVNLEQLEQFTSVAKTDAVQLPLNMLQREILKDLVPYCRSHEIDVHVYWVLMKGILAGKISRSHQFPAGDSRPKYDIYQGEIREGTHQIVDRLKEIAASENLTVAQLSVGWAISQPGITAAIVGAKRPDQVIESAASRVLPDHILDQIEQAISNPNLRAID